MQVLAAFVLLALAPASVVAQDTRFERLAALAAEKMKEHEVPGVAVGISYRGEVAARGFGVTNFEHPLPVTEDTLFQVGSISKTYTGTAVMRLVETGKLRLEAPISAYIPKFRVRDRAASRSATVLTVLTHMGGWEGDLFIETGAGDDAVARAVEQMAELEQVAPFNTFWSYNNAGFYVAARLIELAAGKPYEESLRDLVLAPLGLDHTFIDPADVMTYRFASGHRTGPEGQIVLRPWRLARAAHAVGGVTASIKDLLRYAEFHLGDGAARDGSRVLSATNLERMHRTVVGKQGTDDEMAITWHVSNQGGIRQISHGGATLGQYALLTLVPSRQLAVAVLTNGGRGARLNTDITRMALQQYLDVSITDPDPVATSEADLEELVGRYTRPFADVVVTLEGGRLMLQSIQKQGFPTRATPLPPQPPAAPMAFYAKDRLIAVEGPQKGSRAEVIRRPDGSVGWIRVASRLHRRDDAARRSAP